MPSALLRAMAEVQNDTGLREGLGGKVRPRKNFQGRVYRKQTGRSYQLAMPLALDLVSGNFLLFGAVSPALFICLCFSPLGIKGRSSHILGKHPSMVLCFVCEYSGFLGTSLGAQESHPHYL